MSVLSWRYAVIAERIHRRAATEPARLFSAAVRVRVTDRSVSPGGALATSVDGQPTSPAKVHEGYEGVYTAG